MLRQMRIWAFGLDRISFVGGNGGEPAHYGGCLTRDGNSFELKRPVLGAELIILI